MRCASVPFIPRAIRHSSHNPLQIALPQHLGPRDSMDSASTLDCNGFNEDKNIGHTHYNPSHGNNVRPIVCMIAQIGLPAQMLRIDTPTELESNLDYRIATEINDAGYLLLLNKIHRNTAQKHSILKYKSHSNYERSQEKRKYTAKLINLSNNL